ncbi:MAG TPA: DNA polymerase III subunit alpha, partial [Sphingomonas sp.]
NIFVDDARRLGVTLCGPDINLSGAEFDVEVDDEGPKIRYALAALKSVGEGAMERLVAEREANGRFKSLDDLAGRVDPRLLNKRQLETLAAAGAFDAVEPNRAAVHACADAILAVAASTHHAKTSGQGGLFGEVTGASETIRLPADARWTLAERMEGEKEAFGFYFSAHPVDRHAHIAKSHGARSFAALSDLHIPDDGSRAGATMAVLVEEARYRTSARGKRYLMAQLSDATGQFMATCFDEAVSKDLEAAARESQCALITVELDRRPGEESPRVSVKRVQPFDNLATNARFVIEATVSDPAVFAGLAALLEHSRNARGEVRVLSRTASGHSVTLLLGRDFLLDAELAGRIESLQGVEKVELRTSETRLALVG